MNLNDVNEFAAPIIKEYLTKNQFDGSKIKGSDASIETLIFVKDKDTMTVQLLIPNDEPKDALLLVAVDINVNTKEYKIIPGTSKEVENYKK